jgi:pyruvate ferredoxin oxidoreductase delta subunit
MPGEKGWKDITRGGVIREKGNAMEYDTGSWRTFRPVVDPSKCINCMFCWIFCPESSVTVKDDKMAGFDLKHCKGCGICAKECPKKAIEMSKENK